MTALIHPTGPASAVPLLCPQCAAEFHPRRKNQKYCQKKCAKAATRNSNRGPRTKENAAMSAWHFTRARELNERLYGAPPCERLGLMKEIIERAANGEAGWRRILTDPTFLRASPEDKHLFHRRAPGAYKTISQAANAYTQKFFGVSIQTYLEMHREGNLPDEFPVQPSKR